MTRDDPGYPAEQVAALGAQIGEAAWRIVDAGTRGGILGDPRERWALLSLALAHAMVQSVMIATPDLANRRRGVKLLIDFIRKADLTMDVDAGPESHGARRARPAEDT